VLLAELFLRVAHVGLRLLCDHRAGRADLPLDRRDSLTRDLTDSAGNAGYAGSARLASKLLDARCNAPFVVARLTQVLLKALLVRGLVGQRDMGL
jgi:hypothetical protein